MTELVVVTVPYYDDNFAYLVYDKFSRKTVLFDCGEIGPILRQIQKNGWSLDYIVATHFHYDHAGEIDAMKAHFPGATVIKAAGESRLKMNGLEVRDGDTIPFGGYTIQVMSLPAHTLYCTAYLIDGNLFVGDVLFSAGCGRLFEGTPADLEKALDKICSLPDDTKLYFGHEYTQSNVQFAKSIEPDNDDLEEYRKIVNQLLDTGQFSSPTSLGLQKRINPFLRIDRQSIIQVVDPEGVLSRTERLGILRRMKDSF